MKRGFSGTQKKKQKKSLDIFEDFIPRSKEMHPVSRRIYNVLPSTLNVKQRKAYDLVENHVTSGVDQLLLIVLGVGGTGT